MEGPWTLAEPERVPFSAKDLDCSLCWKTLPLIRRVSGIFGIMQILSRGFGFEGTGYELQASTGRWESLGRWSLRRGRRMGGGIEIVGGCVWCL